MSDGTGTAIPQPRLLYEMIAIEHQLNNEQKELFIDYMMSRWESTAEQKCKTGYAAEWAMRFKDETEFVRSDEIGKRILMEMDKKYIKQWYDYQGLM